MQCEHARKIIRVSFWLKRVTLAILILLPLLNASFWILGGFPSFQGMNFSLIPEFVGQNVPSISALSSQIKLLGFFITMIPIGLSMMALQALGKLFERYEHLEIFSSECVSSIRKFGMILLVAQLIYPVYMAMISLAMTISNPPGHRMISVGFGTTQVLLLMISTAIFLISWIMDEGRKMKEEQDAII